MKGYERLENPGCYLCHPEQATKARKHPDSTRRRRSANADILESVGLPTTGSFNDMKSLNGSTLCKVSRKDDDFCGLRSFVKSITKAAKRAKAAARSSATARTTRTTSRKTMLTALTKERLLPSAENKHQNRGMSVHSSASNRKDDQELQFELQQMPGGYSHSRDLPETTKGCTSKVPRLIRSRLATVGFCTTT